MTRQEAAAAGLTQYNSGKACRAGHKSNRYTSTGTCVKCAKQHGHDMRQLTKPKRTLVKLVVRNENAQAIRDYAELLEGVES